MTTADYDRLVSDAAGIALATESAVNDMDANTVPALILSQLAQLEALTEQLKRTDAPNDATAAHYALIGGLETFQNDLVEISADASRSVSHPGNDAGPRLRYELSLSRGLATIRTALDTLRTAGHTDSGL